MPTVRGRSSYNRAHKEKKPHGAGFTTIPVDRDALMKSKGVEWSSKPSRRLSPSPKAGALKKRIGKK